MIWHFLHGLLINLEMVNINQRNINQRLDCLRIASKRWQSRHWHTALDELHNSSHKSLCDVAVVLVEANCRTCYPLNTSELQFKMKLATLRQESALSRAQMTKGGNLTD